MVLEEGEGKDANEGGRLGLVFSRIFVILFMEYLNRIIKEIKIDGFGFVYIVFRFLIVLGKDVVNN